MESSASQRLRVESGAGLQRTFTGIPYFSLPQSHTGTDPNHEGERERPRETEKKETDRDRQRETKRNKERNRERDK